MVYDNNNISNSNNDDGNNYSVISGGAQYRKVILRKNDSLKLLCHTWEKMSKITYTLEPTIQDI